MTLEERVDRLERSNTKWKRMTVFLTLCLASVFVVGPSRLLPNEIHTQRLVLQDASGKDRISLGELSNGFSGMTVLDTEGVTRMTLGLTRDGVATLLTQTPQGKPGAVLSTDWKSYSDLQIGNEKGQRVFYAPKKD
jgi:hypothetical protein